eukprot:m.124440 g.124440  ORF g.124440 m.124440 type:complete len:247 (+) comp23420_c1_seq1:556-1296(+)
MHPSAAVVGCDIFVIGTASDQFLVSKFDTISQTFRNLTASGGPTPRKQFSLASVGHKLILFGGSDFNNWQARLNEVWVFDTLTESWSSPTVRGVPPTPRHGQCAWALDRFFVVFAGNDGVKTNDLYILDTATFTWSEPTLTTNEKPAERNSLAAAQLSAHQLLFFGGISRDGRERNDIWILDLLYRWTTQSHSSFWDNKVSRRFLLAAVGSTQRSFPMVPIEMIWHILEFLTGFDMGKSGQTLKQQ